MRECLHHHELACRVSLYRGRAKDLRMEVAQLRDRARRLERDSITWDEEADKLAAELAHLDGGRMEP